MSHRNFAWLLGIPVTVLLGLALAFSAPLRQHHAGDQELVKLVAEVLSEVDASYVRELSPEAKRRFVEDMINGGLERLDPHSGFMNDMEFKQFDRKSKGRFGGIGVQITLADRGNGGLLVTSPIVGTPAYEAGIMAGDLILKVDGVSLEGKRSTEAVELIQGEIGKPVTLNVLHDGESTPVDITIVRALIEVQTVLGDKQKADGSGWDYWLDPEHKIAYIRLVEFDEPTANQLREVLSRLTKEGMRGLILDVRTNPGGLLSGAVTISDLFLPGGKIVSTKGRGMPEKTYTAKDDGSSLESPSFPVAVLIDRYSASASEILASALQDNDRAVVIGERSYGKGSVQNLLHLTTHPNSALKLTTASYWRPNGRNIHRFPDSKDTDDWGVLPTPNFEVKLTDEERKQYFLGRRKRDVLAGKNGAKKSDDAPFTDKVLEKGLASIRDRLST